MQVAKKINLSHQQLQKYEMAINRVTVGRLTLIARALEKDVSYFFDKEDREQPNELQRLRLEASRSFAKIPNPKHKIAINELLHALSKG